MAARTRTRRILAFLALSVIALPPPAAAGHDRGYDFLIGENGVDAPTPVRFVATGDFGAGDIGGIVLKGDTIYQINCAQLQQNRDGSGAFFVRAASGGETLYGSVGEMRRFIDNLDSAMMIGSAMGGVTDRRSSADGDRCGAAYTPTSSRFYYGMVDRFSQGFSTPW